MIAVVGVSGAGIAAGAAAAGASVQLVVAVPDGDDGDARVLAWSHAGIGHAAVVRRSGIGLEAADVALALRYLPDIRVIVLVHPDAEFVRPAVEAGAWAEASLIAVVEPGAGPPADLPPDAIVIGAKASDDPTSSGVEAFVARLAADLDAGRDASAALASAEAAVVADRVGAQD